MTYRWGVRFLKPAEERIALGALISKNLFTGEVSTLAPSTTTLRSYVLGRTERFRTKAAARKWAARFSAGTVEVVDLKGEGVSLG